MHTARTCMCCKTRTLVFVFFDCCGLIQLFSNLSPILAGRYVPSRGVMYGEK